MACHGGFSLDEQTRRQWYNPEIILQTIGLRVGMTFADIGSGDGFFTFLASKIVGENGKVYATDIDPLAIKRLNDKAKKEDIRNITATAGKAEETVFCKDCVDVLFFSMDLHDFDDPAKVLHNAHEMVKPSGLVADLDWKKIEIPVGPPFEVKFSEKQVEELMAFQGLHVQHKMDVGPYHYLVTAKPFKK
jgi:ubiquinone/menaquinone biosynthesis C-methylase UbiE